MFRLRLDEEGLRFLLERGEAVPERIVTDEGKLRQILLNLLGNAVKFTQEGVVALRVHAQETGDGYVRLELEVEFPDPAGRSVRPCRFGSGWRTGTRPWRLQRPTMVR